MTSSGTPSLDSRRFNPPPSRSSTDRKSACEKNPGQSVNTLRRCPVPVRVPRGSHLAAEATAGG